MNDLIALEYLLGDHGGATLVGIPQRPAPGKVTLTERLGARGSVDGAGDAPTVQRDATGAAPALSSSEAGAIAEHGVGGASGRLPFADVIAGSFGRHDISNVRVATGGPAADASTALGARAYATGDTIAFAREPDLHLAAHEAAHVVQQRAGVHLAGGIGAAGDAYERHADAVADAVVRGESAEALLDQHARGGAGGVQRAVQRDANAVGFSPRWAERPDELAAIQQQLRDAGFPPADASVAATQTALRAFQARHGEEIDQVQRDSAHMRDHYAGPASADEGTVATDGELGPNDATAQTLANAWPRRFFGTLLQTPEDGFDYLASQVRARGLPFDPQRVNIVGLRGVQGGTFHGHANPGMRSATYEDSFFLLALNEHGDKMIREFRGTTEPGGRSTAERHDGGSERTADPDTQTLLADQQSIYSFSADSSEKFHRPMMSPRVETRDGQPLVVAPGFEGEDRLRDTTTGSGRASDLAAGVSPDDAGMHRRQRTQETGGGVLHRGHGIAIHSGGGADQIFADSTGCQVVHGDWYGGFIGALRRALDCARVRRGEAPARADSLDGTPTEGEVLYSILDGANLERADVRGAIRDERSGEAERRRLLAVAALAAAREPVAPVPGAPVPAARPVQRDGGGDGGGSDHVHAVAAAGVAGTGGALPHQDAIQASFGHHDVAGVRAHVGGPAAEAAGAIGARAYATGDDVAFAAAPDLRQAAHEAAHVVQQRGGVRLDGGVGRAGDPYEQHADAVADLVTRGESAESLLDRMAHRGAGGGAAVQRDGEVCEVAPDPAQASCEPGGEGEAEAVETVRRALPELAAVEPGLRAYDGALMGEARTRFRVPERGWTDTRAADGATRRIDLSTSLRGLVGRVHDDPTVVAHIRETLDMFYNDPDPRSHLDPGEIDLALVLAIANRESAGSPILLSTGDRRVVTAGRDTHRAGVGGLDYAGDLRREFPTAIRDHVTEVQDDAGLRAGLRPNRQQANPAEVRERDLLAAYIVEVHHREERFERLYRRAADDHLNPEQVEQLLAGLGRDGRRAWIQASFGSRLPAMLRDVLGRFQRAMHRAGAEGFATALADDHVNLNAIVAEDAVMDAAGLSGHRTRITAAEASMLDVALPASLAGEHVDVPAEVAECVPGAPPEGAMSSAPPPP